MNFPISKSPKPPFTIENVDNVIRSAMEDGYEITRPRFTKVRKNITGVKWDLTNSEYQILDDFYCSYGSTSFTITFNIAKGTSGDLGIAITKIVRFTKPPSFAYQGMGVWEATCDFRQI